VGTDLNWLTATCPNDVICSVCFSSVPHKLAINYLSPKNSKKTKNLEKKLECGL
jgi:hypothetical protein